MFEHRKKQYCFTVPGLSTAKGMAFALQANNPHTKELTLTILRLQENNFLDGLRRKWWETSSSCPEEEDTGKKQLIIIYFKFV